MTSKSDEGEQWLAEEEVRSEAMEVGWKNKGGGGADSGDGSKNCSRSRAGDEGPPVPQNWTEL